MNHPPNNAPAQIPFVHAVLTSGDDESPRPELRAHYESTARDVFVIGDLAGAPVIKMAMSQAVELIDHIASLPEATGNAERFDKDVWDLVVCGAGAAGLAAGLAAMDHGMHTCVLERGKIANTIEEFPEGKWVYAEPDDLPPKGKLWLDGATKEELVARWHAIVQDNNLDVRTERSVDGVERDGALLVVRCENGETYRARRVVVAIGRRGNPRKLRVDGEDQEWVYHRLYSPKLYRDERVLVVGGGNSAIEAALQLSQHNAVTISYRGDRFDRVFKDNARLLADAVSAGRVRVLYGSRVEQFDSDFVGSVQSPGQAWPGLSSFASVDRPADATARRSVTARPNKPNGDQSHWWVRAAVLRTADGQERLEIDHAFILIGSEPPIRLLKRIGVRMENEWTGNSRLALGLTLLPFAVLGICSMLGFRDWSAGLRHAIGWSVMGGTLLTLAIRGRKYHDRYAWLGFAVLIVYAVYGISKNLWPYTAIFDTSHIKFHILGRDRGGSFFYTILYCVLMLIFGVGAMRRWGTSRGDTYQIVRIGTLISFQWVMFFVVPEFLWRWGVLAAGVSPESSLADPGQSWRSYGLFYAWPLFSHAFLNSPPLFWVVYSAVLAFLVIPVLVLFHGKRYCSWVCGCGGLSETLGDRWRHLAPKGRTAMKLEAMGGTVFAAALVATLLPAVLDGVDLFRAGSSFFSWAKWLYARVVDLWLVALIPMALYPFLGSRVWCRYWCPLAKMMEWMSRFFTRRNWSRFGIIANNKCIACGECTRYCQVGIPVMRYALRQDVLDNATSSCIGCGICVTVCPMDVLSYGTTPHEESES